MDKVYVIRHKALVEGEIIRSVVREMRVGRNTVVRYLALSVSVLKSVSRPHQVMETEQLLPAPNLLLYCATPVNGKRISRLTRSFPAPRIEYLPL